jgi:PAS domain S-box-containing protein
METRNIFERKQTDKQLQLLSSIAEMALDAIIVTDTNFKIVYVNNAAQDLYGYSEKELIGNTLAMLNEEPISAEIQKDIYRIVKKGEVWLGSILKKKKDGSTFICGCKIAPYYDNEGQIVAYISINRDITKGENWEQQHRAIMQAAVDGFWTRNLEGKLLEVNDAYCKMTGYTSKELLEMSISDFEAIEIPEDTTRRIQKLNKQGYNQLFETRHKCKDGRIIDVEISSSYLDMGNGQIITFIRNITERKEAEKFLIESELKYRDLYDNAPVTYFSVNNDGLIIESNKAAQNWLGYSAEELKGMEVLDIYVEESRPKARLLLERFKQGQSTESEEMVYLRKDKHRVYGLLSVSPVIDSYDKVVASRSVVKDITERKQMDEELSQYSERLEELVKERTVQLSLANEQLESMLQQQRDMINQRADFTRALVHELKTPLTGIISSSEILTTRLQNKLELKLAKNIYKGALNLNNRIDELLDLAKGEVGILKVTCKSLNSLRLIREVAEGMTPEARKRGQSIILDIPRSLPNIWADRERIRQVLLNLISNALKFNSENGRLTIRARAEGTYNIFEIQDEGRGMTGGEQERLFQPYYRTDSDREKLNGLGLGLALSKRLIELHQGQIWAKSQEGEGSTFIFSIPLATEVEHGNGEKHG